MDDIQARNEHGDLVRIDQTNARDVARWLQVRGGANHADGVALVRAARERGELHTVFALAEDGRDLEAFCDANDHDVSTQAAMQQVHPRELADRLCGVRREAIQWRLAPLPIVLAALLLESLTHLVERKDVVSEVVDDDDDDDDVLQGFLDGADDEPHVERDSPPSSTSRDDRGVPAALGVFHEVFCAGFGEVFEPTEGMHSTIDAIRADRIEALDTPLDAYVSNVRELVEINLARDQRLHSLCREDVEQWVSVLIGEAVEPELVVEELLPVEEAKQFVV